MAFDFPKIQSPFIREETIDGYCVVDKINPGYDWVFTDDSVACIEKLDGTNVSVIIRDGRVQSIWNRTTEIPFFNKGKGFIIRGVIEAYDRGYLALPDGQHFGELIGPKVNGNCHRLTEHLWVPFQTYGMNHLRYKTWGKYPKNFESISSWLENDIFSLFGAKRGYYADDALFPEGVVFHHPDGRMAKLRRDMFPWFEGNRHNA